MVAFYYHPDLDVARATRGVAPAGIGTAGGRLNPTLGVAPAYNFNHINAQPGLSPWLPAVPIDVPIETAGKRLKPIAQAENVSETARLDIIATAWDIRSKVRGSLLNIRSKVRGSLLNIDAARQRQIRLQKQIEAQEQVVQLMEKQAQAGAATPLEMLNAKLECAVAEMGSQEARIRQQQSLAAIEDALQRPIGLITSAVVGNSPETMRRKTP